MTATTLATIAQPSPGDPQAAALGIITERFQASTDGVLEAIAAEYGLSPRAVAGCLPAETGARISGAHFQAVMDDVATWGDILLIVHTADLILECRGPLPRGQEGHGFFNLSGPGAIGGHIRHRSCTDIQFVSRPFMGRASHAILFFNGDGGVMFKLFVGRDEGNGLRADQVARFRALRDRFAAVGADHSANAAPA